MTFLICQGFVSIQPVKAVHLLIQTNWIHDIYKKTGGSISGKLIINGSLDVKTNITLPEIGDVEDKIQGKQDTINDGDLTIEKISGLQTALDNKYDDTGGAITGSVDVFGFLFVDGVNEFTEIGTK